MSKFGCKFYFRLSFIIRKEYLFLRRQRKAFALLVLPKHRPFQLQFLRIIAHPALCVYHKTDTGQVSGISCPVIGKASACDSNYDCQAFAQLTLIIALPALCVYHNQRRRTGERHYPSDVVSNTGDGSVC